MAAIMSYLVSNQHRDDVARSLLRTEQAEAHREVDDQRGGDTYNCGGWQIHDDPPCGDCQHCDHLRVAARYVNDEVWKSFQDKAAVILQDVHRQIASRAERAEPS